MEFLHIHGVPIPKVFDWNSSASNQIGCECIIIERVQGKELVDTWYTMTFKERMAVIEKIVDIERILFNVQFPACGSFFFKDSLDARVKSVDIPENRSLKDISRFCIGPSTEYLWWYQKQNELAVNRRPCKHLIYMIAYQLTGKFLGESSKELLRAVGEKEVLWLWTFGEK